MTDPNSQFFAILTAIGEAKQANADALGIPWTFAQMAVGDANGTDPIPDRLQTRLVNERRRAPLNQVSIDPNNASIIIAEQVIPENVGGWWVREAGLYDADGDLVAVANCAPTYKPLLSQGSGRTQIIRINLIVSSTANIELKIDPSVVLATRKYVDDRTRRVATQPEVDAGVLDNVSVTPKTLRWKFLIIRGATGCIVFPSWLGGWMAQWSTVYIQSAENNTKYQALLPFAFPNAIHGLIGCTASEGEHKTFTNVTGDLTPSSFSVAWGNSNGTNAALRYFAIGY
ncbi:hypothetical protein HBO22_06425 [Pseudomonas gessardii]|nr:hypothetical protein [Pseudomonas gessardii]